MEKELTDIMETIENFNKKFNFVKIEMKLKNYKIPSKPKEEIKKITFDIFGEYHSGGDYKKFYCKSCKVFINTNKNLKIHLNTNKHHRILNGNLKLLETEVHKSY